jgi:hypothetical protein
VPLQLELARTLGPEAGNLQDPAWSAHHALLAWDCTDQLQEPLSCSAAGLAVPVAAFEAAAAAEGLVPLMSAAAPLTAG